MKNFIVLFSIGVLFLSSQNCSKFQSLNNSSQSSNARDQNLGLSSILNQDFLADNLWIGPMAFGPDDTSSGWAVPNLRPGYSDLIEYLNPLDLKEGRFNVFKTYIMILPKEVSSDEQLHSLITQVEKHHLKVAIEVGGMRTGSFCGTNAGISNAESELVHLLRWISLGGKIDFITTDHSIMSSLSSPILGTGLSSANCRMTLDQLVDEQINYFATLRTRLPNVKFGMIESLGYFNFKNVSANQSANRKAYHVTDSRLPGWDLVELITQLMSRAASRNISIDHFHLDFGLEGVEFDGRSDGGSRVQNNDYGRIALVKEILQQHGIRSGIIVNADGTSDVSASERTVQFLKELLLFNQLEFDHIVLQSWFHKPATIGSYSTPNTALGLINSLISEMRTASPEGCSASPAFAQTCINHSGISEGLFRVDTTIYFSNGQRHYCMYNDWEKFKVATGVSDVSIIRLLPSIPSVMISDGVCVLA